MPRRHHRAFDVTFAITLTALLIGCRKQEPVPEDLVPFTNQVAIAEVGAAPPASGAPPLAAPLVLTPTPFTSSVPPGLGSPIENGACSLDSVTPAVFADVTAVARAGTVKLVGWAAESPASPVPKVIFIELIGAKGKLYAAASRLTKRPDVAIALKQPPLVDSGWDLLTSFESVEPGEYSVRVVQVNQAGVAFRCDTRRKIKVG